MISETQMLVLGGQADDDAHQATLGDLHKFDFGEISSLGEQQTLKSVNLLSILICRLA